MKKSNYNIYIPTENGNTLVFNTITQGILELEKGYIDKLNQPNKFSNAEIELLFEYGILTKGDKQKELILNEYTNKKFCDKNMYLTITLTNQCNFSCKYCYQDREIKKLDEEKSNHIINYIKNKIENGVENLFIHWFGGEPLMNISQALYIEEQILDICEKNNCNYRSGMTTNGYLVYLQYDKLKKMKIDTYNITLDGIEEHHNFTRPLREGSPSYKKVLDNIKILLENRHEVCIRYNINRRNKNIGPFFDELKSHGLISKVKFSFARTMRFENSDPIEDFYIESDEEYAYILMNIYKEMLKYNIPIPKYGSLGVNCVFECINSYVVNTELELFRCSEEDEAMESKMGIINDGKEIIIPEAQARKVEESPINNSICKDCKLTPLCKGGCPLIKSMNQKACIPEKYVIEEYIKILYLEEIQKNN